MLEVCIFFDHSNIFYICNTWHMWGCLKRCCLLGCRCGWSSVASSSLKVTILMMWRRNGASWSWPCWRERRAWGLKWTGMRGSPHDLYTLSLHRYFLMKEYGRGWHAFHWGIHLGSTWHFWSFLSGQTSNNTLFF